MGQDSAGPEQRRGSATTVFGTLAFLVIALAWLSRREPLNTIVVPGHFHDLGNLMLAFTMLWAYISFSLRRGHR